MATPATPRGGRRDPLAALLVAAVVLMVSTSSSLRPSAAQPSAGLPAFPRQVAAYSWWTGMLSLSPLDAATLLYQNGVGVEFLDSPQSVLLGVDGSSYRRLDLAESLSIAADQGDPAQSVLSPDGTFVVVAGADGHGKVQVVTLRDGSARAVSIGAGRSAAPTGIGADGRTVLLLTSDRSLSPLEDIGFRLHGALASLDLVSGELRDYPGLDDVNAAALSPDGSRIVADTSAGAVLADASDGRIVARLPAVGPIDLDGDAWSPDGRRVALMSASSLVVVDTARPEDPARSLPLTGIEFGSAIGWRDAETVLVHAGAIGDSNESGFLWVDLRTGRQELISSYVPDFTGAALVGPDAARELVPAWQVRDRPVGRGPLPLPLAAVLAAGAGLLVLAFTPRRRRESLLTASGPRAR